MLHVQGRLQSQVLLLELIEKPFQELPSTQQTVGGGVCLTPTPCTPHCQGPVSTLPLKHCPVFLLSA